MTNRPYDQIFSDTYKITTLSNLDMESNPEYYVMRCGERAILIESTFFCSFPEILEKIESEKKTTLSNVKEHYKLINGKNKLSDKDNQFCEHHMENMYKTIIEDIIAPYVILTEYDPDTYCLIYDSPMSSYYPCHNIKKNTIKITDTLYMHSVVNYLIQNSIEIKTKNINDILKLFRNRTPNEPETYIDKMLQPESLFCNIKRPHKYRIK